jgi:hypothetical protein
MKKSYFTSSLIIASIFSAVIITACSKDAAPPAAAPDYSWNEEFDTIANSFAKGWVAKNTSRPLGYSTWNQASVVGLDSKGKAIIPSYPFSAQSAVYSGKDFIMVDLNSVDDAGTISNWLLSPATMMKNGDQITFYARTVPAGFNTTDVPERMQVRLAPNSSNGDIGNSATSVGDFTTLMLDINPTYAINGTAAFPRNWQKYTLTISGLPPTIQSRRFAFRYLLENGGATGGRGFCAGIDNVTFISK